MKTIGEPGTGRPPLLTLAIAAATSLLTVAALAYPSLLALLERNEARIAAGEFWRLLTSFLVLGDNATQIGFNLAGLLLLGTPVERRLPRRLWAIAYLGGGVVGQLAGLYWKPFGAGNSVAIAGLAGLLLVHMARREGATLPQRLAWPVAGFGFAAWLSLIQDIHGLPVFAGALAGLMPRR
ncbi:MAG: rhomboid family intramembrane serine protease [Pseudomonadota bacterium]|nr:rhomboid family intramembrane serine protease [Pseudomonadota bacterium]